ncbi:Pentatricopeptide repeat-containing protein, partial [Drosera capensis]
MSRFSDKDLTKWMLSKGQGKTMGTYYTLLNALAEEDRLEEVEDLWRMLLKKYLEGYRVFADMEDLSVQPTMPIVFKVGTVFLKLKMMDKYQKLHKKSPPPRWEYKYFKGRRVRVRAKQS